MESLYNYLLANYKENEPILSASLSISGISPTNMRQQLKKLTDSGKLKRFDSGVYYPDRLYKNLVETRVIYNGILAQ